MPNMPNKLKLTNYKVADGGKYGGGMHTLPSMHRQESRIIPTTLNHPAIEHIKADTRLCVVYVAACATPEVLLRRCSRQLVEICWWHCGGGAEPLIPKLICNHH